MGLGGGYYSLIDYKLKILKHRFIGSCMQELDIFNPRGLSLFNINHTLLQGLAHVHALLYNIHVHAHAAKVCKYRSVPGKRPWALNHKPSFLTILGACPVYGALTVCNN